MAVVGSGSRRGNAAGSCGDLRGSGQALRGDRVVGSAGGAGLGAPNPPCRHSGSPGLDFALPIASWGRGRGEPVAEMGELLSRASCSPDGGRGGGGRAAFPTHNIARGAGRALVVLSPGLVSKPLLRHKHAEG